MRIMGLDISTKTTGWFITKKFCGKIEPDPDLLFSEKLVYFRDELSRLLLKHKPELVVIEDTYLRFGNPQTLKQLTRFSGVAMEVCFRSGAKVELITATQARKFCCGEQKGEFKKKEVFQYFIDKYKITDWTFKDHNDITDAIALVKGYSGKEKSIAPKGDT